MYRFVDHTADIAFEVVAETLPELLRDSGIAFYEAFAFVEKLESKAEREVVVSEDSPDYLLYSWLNELLYLFDTEKFAGKRIDVHVDEKGTLRAVAKIYGDKLTPEKVKLEPKAITLHNFRVEKKEDGWYAFVVVDI